MVWPESCLLISKVRDRKRLADLQGQLLEGRERDCPSRRNFNALKAGLAVSHGSHRSRRPWFWKESPSLLLHWHMLDVNQNQLKFWKATKRSELSRWNWNPSTRRLGQRWCVCVSRLDTTHSHIAKGIDWWNETDLTEQVNGHTYLKRRRI